MLLDILRGSRLPLSQHPTGTGKTSLVCYALAFLCLELLWILLWESHTHIRHQQFLIDMVNTPFPLLG